MSPYVPVGSTCLIQDGRDCDDGSYWLSKSVHGMKYIQV